MCSCAYICNLCLFISLVRESLSLSFYSNKMKRRLPKFAIILLLLGWTLHLGETQEVQGIDQFKGQPRLPKFTIPKHYDIFLKPDIPSAQFVGTVQIRVDVIKDTKFLVLNAANLIIDRTSVNFQGNTSQEFCPLEVVLVEDDEIMVLVFDNTLPHGEGVLKIGFEGILKDWTNDDDNSGRGFYRSLHNINGEKKYMAYTQLEAADARRCFPCWDEPALKAKFTITLEVLSDLTTMSNMPVAQENSKGSTKVVSFQESPIMSTYLVSIVIGYYNYIESATKDGAKVRAYYPIGQLNTSVVYALDVGVKSLDLFAEFFDTPYPLPKLDMVPIRMSADGMENFGIITMRTGKLVNVSQRSITLQQFAVETIIHEMAHQWFGNLVTMEWWTDLWLNEGFADWASYYGMDILYPGWEAWTYVNDMNNMEFWKDATKFSHPIQRDIKRANDAADAFDDIAYIKGSFIIRMLQNYIGPETFQKALATYIKRFSYSSIRTEDLSAVLEEVSGDPMKILMTTWTNQTGYPVISVSNVDHKLQFEQSRFYFNGSAENGQWIVPITFYSGSQKSIKRYLLKTKSGQVDIEQDLRNYPNTNEAISFWVKVNVDNSGYYRVKYDDTFIPGLQYAIKANLLTSNDRYGILDDSMALCMACEQSISSLLSLVASYSKEDNYYIISKIITVSKKVIDAMTEVVPELISDVKKIFANVLQYPAGRIGWDPEYGESDMDQMLREKLLIALAKLGDEATLNEGIKRFHASFETKSTSINYNKAALVAYLQSTIGSTMKGSESLFTRLKEADTPEDKSLILSSLAYSPNPDIVLSALNYLLTPEGQTVDINQVIEGIGIEARNVAFTWVKDNWQKWDSAILNTIINIIPPMLSDDKEIAEMEKLSSSIDKEWIMVPYNVEQGRVNANFVKCLKNEQSLGGVVKKLIDDLLM